jgi:signal transduction histidine kinase
LELVVSFPAHQSIRLLFVDDEVQFLDTLREYFEPFATVMTAKSAEEALPLLADFRPDVIISDQRMGLISGVDFLQKSITVSPDSERILMTAYGDISSVVQSINRARISYYLTKPVDFHQLKLAIEQLSEASTLRRENDALIKELQNSNADLEHRVAERNAELQNANTILNQLQKTREQMVRMAVHDLKTPLGNIELVLHEFERGGLTPDDFKELTDIAKQSTRIMRGLVEDMLTVAVISQPQFHLAMDELELTPFLTAICSSFEQAAKTKSIHFSVTIPDNLPIIQADSQQLQHVVSNLVSNAIKYTPYNGAVEFLAWSDAGIAIIQVKDNGLGMTQEDISQAFQEFRRLSARPTGGESSTGLGLFIVKKIVELHNGSVSIFSEGKDKGTTFTVKLPM